MSPIITLKQSMLLMIYDSVQYVIQISYREEKTFQFHPQDIHHYNSAFHIE